MCGIVGYAGKDNAVSMIIDGLSKLEYRGYDSAGIAIINNQTIHIQKKKGRLKGLEQLIGEPPLANIGIGHTRWATHGVPSDINAHPHGDCTGKICVVHNGIIENYGHLRSQLTNEGHIFVSETDTEVIAHLIEKYYKNNNIELAVRQAMLEVQGSYAIAVISEDEPNKIVAAKKGSPLIVGLGEGENYLASDIPAILSRTRKVYILEDFEFIVLTDDNIVISDFEGNIITKDIFNVDWDPIAAEKGGYEHFMLKEIHEQPVAIKETLLGTIKDGIVNLADFGIEELLRDVEKIYIVACGTAYHAGLVGRLAIEKLARIPVETDIASEFRYRDVIWDPHSLMIVVSQSGETADTLAALKEAQRQGIKVLAITNVVGSTVSREADKVIYTRAGPEIAVASTKAYTTQLVIMFLLALDLARIKNTLSQNELEILASDLLSIDKLAEKVLQSEENIKEIAHRYQNVQSTFFLGRGFDHAVAMEGALKLKEISYIHAEAYAAGELKHGPLALIYEGVPVLALISQDNLVEKTLSNIKEVKARGAVVVAVCKEKLEQVFQECDESIYLPEVNQILAPIVAVIPLQIFAYYMALFRGADVDKPRNLAKSVTVE